MIGDAPKKSKTHSVPQFALPKKEAPKILVVAVKCDYAKNITKQKEKKGYICFVFTAFSNATTPGSFLPIRNSINAPPAVLI